MRHINLPFNTKHLGIKLKTLISCDHLILYNDVDQTITFFGPNDFIFSYGNSPLQLVDQTGQGDIITALVSLSLSVGASPKESVILSYRGWRLANQQLGTGKINKKKLIE